MSNFLNLRDYAFLSQAAYRDLSGLSSKPIASDLERKLTVTEPGSYGADNVFALGQAKQLTGTATTADPADGYTFLNQRPNQSSGFSATVFQANGNGNRITIAVRGTEPSGGQIVADLLNADIMGVVLAGKAKLQLFDAYRYYKQLTATAGDPVLYTQAELVDMARLIANVGSPALLVGQYALSLDTGLGLIPQNAAVDFTGHSLGGHVTVLLADMVARNRGESTVGNVITYNAPGMGGILTEVQNWFNAGIQFNSAISSRTLNVIAEDGMNMTAGLAGLAGTRLLVPIEGEANGLGPSGLLPNHSVVKLSESLAFQSLLRAIDPNVSEAQMKSVMRALESTSIATLERGTEALYKLFKGSSVTINRQNRNALYEKINELQEFIAGTNRTYTIAFLTGISADGLKGLAIDGDLDARPYRYALKELNPFAILGDNSLYAKFNTNHELDLFDSQSGKGLSPQWLEDRANMLETLAQANTADDLKVFRLDANGTWDYEDRTQNKKVTLTNFGINIPDAVRHKVTFGKDQTDGSTETLVGGDLSDHLYGGAGADVLKGGGDADNLEGGRDNDLLIGGTGVDTYLYASGDGADTIEDTDGQIKIAGLAQALSGTLNKSGLNKLGQRTWNDPNGVQYTLLDGDLVTGGTLRISGSPLGGGKNSIDIKNFKNADLGLTFDTSRRIEVKTGAGQNTFLDLAHQVVGTVTDLSEGMGKTVTVFLSTAAKAGETLALNIAGGLANAWSAVFGDDEQSFGNGALTVALAEGQTQVTFSLVNTGDIDTSGAWQLSAALTDANGQEAASHQMQIDFTATVEAEGTQTTTRDIAGDLRLWDSDPATPGDQLQNDDIGNPIQLAGQASPGLADTLNDSGGNDHITALAGNDDIHAGRGGDDWIQLGDGDDIADGGAGNDLIEGEAGADIVAGDSGDDRVFAGSRIALADAIAQGETETAAAGGPEWIDGGAGKDVVIGGATADVLMGGAGADVLVGGGGDDLLHGDSQRNFVQMGWSVTRDVTTSGAITNYTTRYTDADATLASGGEADALYGGAGNDWLYGETGDDLLDGGVGDDLLVGGDGADTLLGRAGADVLNGDAGDDFLDGGEGDDRIIGGAGADALYGGLGNDTLSGDALDTPAADQGADYLDGEEGDDLLIGGGGADQLYGGTGNDQLYGEAANTPDAVQGDDYLDGEEGDDLLVGGGGSDVLMGGAGNDELYGEASDTPIAVRGDDYLDGEDGNDILVGAGGADTLIGGTGDDLLAGDATGLDAQYHGADLLDGGDGNDTLIGGGGADSLSGGDGNDQLFGDGDELAASDQADDRLDGGAGNDYLRGQGGNDSLMGGSGDDQLLGEAGNDTLVGGAGLDAMDGGTGDDLYLFNVGDGPQAATTDTLIDAAGNDTLRLGAGITVEALTTTLVNASDLLLDTGTDRLLIRDGFNGAIERFEFADGSAYSASELIGRSLATVQVQSVAAPGAQLQGGKLADSLASSGGNATVNGGRGNDTIEVSGTNNIIQYAVGDGSDRVVTATGANNGNVLKLFGVTADELKLGLGSLALQVGDDANDVIHFETFNQGDVYATRPFDRIEFDDGTTLSYEALMAKGFDIAGSAQADVITGTNVDDRIVGGAGDDLLDGGAGNDVLAGGTGNDVLQGGTGNDTYLFNAGDGQDIVIDLAGANAVEFGAGLSVTGMVASQRQTAGGASWLDLEFGNGDRLSIRQGELDRVQAFRFADGTTLTTADLLASMPSVHLTGDAGANTLQGYAGADVLGGLGGNDLLSGGAGNDTLDGGAGNDVLRGGAGTDSYRLGWGTGQDRVEEVAGETSIIRLDAGIGFDSLQAVQTGSDVTLKLRATGDALRLTNYATGNWQLVQADGTTMGVAEILARPALSGEAALQQVWRDTENAAISAAGSNGGQFVKSASGANLVYRTEHDEDTFYGWANDGRAWTASALAASMGLGFSGFTAAEKASGILYSNNNSGTATWLEGGPVREAVTSEIRHIDINASDVQHLDVGGTDVVVVQNTSYLASAYTRERLDVSWLAEGSQDLESSTHGARFATATQIDPWIGQVQPDPDSSFWDYHTNLHQLTLVEGSTYSHTTVSNAEVLSSSAVADTDFSRRLDVLYGNQIDTFVTNNTQHNVIGEIQGDSRNNVIEANKQFDRQIWDSWSNGYIWILKDNQQVDLVDGGAGDDQLAGDDRDLLYGNDGNDSLGGGSVLIGGRGTDLLDGGAGGDAYWVLNEDSVDTINDTGTDSIPQPPYFYADDYRNLEAYYGNGIAADRVILPQGVTLDNVRISGNDETGYLLIDMPDGTGLKVALAKAGDLLGTGIELFEFANGTVLKIGDLVDRMNLARTVDGSADNDTIVTGSGADVVRAGAGDDAIGAGGGNDVLDGGTGNDMLVGGAGDDVYRFESGDGMDTISQEFATSADLDVIRFGAGIAAADVTVSRDADGIHLVLGGGDEVVIRQQPGQATLPVVEFADGTRWDESVFAAAPLRIAGTMGNDALVYRPWIAQESRRWRNGEHSLPAANASTWRAIA